MSDPTIPSSDDPLHGNAPSDLLRAALEGEECPIPASHTSWQAPAPEELALLMPHYSITRLIGRGGMGAVYQGVQLSLDRDVAIKLLPPELGAEPEFEARFKREAMALARLNHPNIVQIHDYGQTIGGHHYIVMEYVDGSDLHQLIRSGGLDVAEALNAVGQICGALDFAHGEGFVHRDIKPANIFITRKGVLKIGDFGLAKLTGAGSPGGNDADHLTRSDVIMGTLHYIAPEQLGGNDAIDHRADIFSLGVMFYEMLTGTVPRGVFRPPSERVRALDMRIDGVVFKAMEEDPDDRYQSAADLMSDVEAIRAATPAKPGPGAGAAFVPATPPAKTRQGLRSLPARVVGMSVIAGLVSWAFWHRGGPPKLPEENPIGVDDSVILPPPGSGMPRPPLTPDSASSPDAVRKVVGEEEPTGASRSSIPSAASRSIEPLRAALAECRELDRKWRDSVPGAPMPAFEVFFVRDEDPRSLGASFVGLEAMSKKERWTPLDKTAAHSFAFQFAKSARDLTDNLKLLNGRSRSGDGDKDREFPRELIDSGLTEKLKEAVHTVITDVAFAETEPNRDPNPEAVTPNTPQTKTSLDPNKATKDQPFANSLGMKFVPVPETGVLFCIHETRFRDYEAYASENPGIANNWRNQTHDGFVITSRAVDHPVTWVSWSETKAFCDWLSKKEGRHYRLPTDAEWKSAAGMAGRPGKGIPTGRPYSWGSEWPPPPSAGNYSDQSRKAKAPAPYPSNYLENYDDGFPTTAPVMSFAPNEFGLYDLGGNVWEWLDDKEKETGEARLRRGGSWRLGSQADLQLSYLLSNEPAARDPIHGFRLVLVP
jgi:serine/threonine protein kinase